MNGFLKALGTAGLVGIGAYLSQPKKSGGAGNGTSGSGRAVRRAKPKECVPCASFAAADQARQNARNIRMGKY